MLNEQVFLEFYGSTAASLRQYVARTLGSVRQADDIVQEAFLRILRNPPSTEAPQELRAFLFRVANNLMTDGWRKQKHEAKFLQQPADAAVDPDLSLSLDMTRNFQKLRPLDRQLMWLAYVEGANHREIAATLGLRERSVRVLLSRARAKLGDLLGFAFRSEKVRKKQAILLSTAEEKITEVMP